MNSIFRFNLKDTIELHLRKTLFNSNFKNVKGFIVAELG